MGLYEPAFVSELKRRDILWLATVTTVEEAKAAESAGADAVVAQGSEAGGHRGAFHADEAEQRSVGLFALLPQVVDALKIPVIATGGIADATGVAAALLLGASAVQIGTGFLRAPEALTPASYADRLARTEAHETVVTRAFSGRPGRAIANAYVRAAMTGPTPAPYPIQRALTAAMREEAKRSGNAERMQMWAGQSAKLARSQPAREIVRQLWNGSRRLLAEAGKS
jgi:nitronate monooxygenase